ncbi:hypothetical protein C8R44DRAFT_895676 [Mycena epipterygia]|nr:hypothetical protein C8R44DRAFT_895676 [Mycena epipterygia]
MPATHHPVATQLAERLHLSGSTDTLLGPADHALFVKQAKDAYGNVEEGKIEIITASFSARFLPAVVDAYKSTSHLITPYSTMLRMVLDSGYFAKFMRGSSGKDLYKVHAERLAELDFTVDVHNEDGMEESIAILVFLMVYSNHYHRNIESLSKNTKAKLITVLRAVQDFYETILVNNPLRPGAMPSLRLRVAEKLQDAEGFLRGQLTSNKMLGAVGRMMPWITCGGYDTGCWTKGKQKGRLGCARCETQTYCSKEHRKADWPAHKKSCFETVY